MRWYRALLRLYPQSFRAEYGDEMAAIFADARRTVAGWRPVAGALVRSRSRCRRERTGGPRRPAPAGPAGRHALAAASARVRHRRRPHRGAGHRRHHRDLRRCRPRADSAAAIPGARSPGEAVPGPDVPRLPEDGGRAAELPRLEAHQPLVRTAGGLHRAVRNARRDRRPGAPEWRRRDRGSLRHAGCAGGAGARADDGGRSRRRRAGARHQPSVVDDAVRRRVDGHRTIGSSRRHPARHRRRDAGALQLSIDGRPRTGRRCASLRVSSRIAPTGGSTASAA